MRAVEELVCRKFEKRAPDELSPKPDPYELCTPRGCSLLLPAAIANGGQASEACAARLCSHICSVGLIQDTSMALTLGSYWCLQRAR